jgi:large subunit ribosomal protein L25
MADIKLKAEERKVFGRKVKRLREDGVLPANVFGTKVKSRAIQVDAGDFKSVFKEAGETNIIELSIGKNKVPVLIHNIQKDPISENYIHADFLQVDLKQKVSAQVPVVVVNESPAEKQGLGTLVQYFDEIEVEALPTELPEKFEIDASKLVEADQEFKVGELVFDKKKVTIELADDTVVVKVEPPRKEEEPSPAETKEAPEEAVGVVKESGESEEESAEDSEVGKEG